MVKKIIIYIFPLFSLILGSGCSSSEQDLKLMKAEDFTCQIDGQQVGLYTLRGGDLTMQVTNYGGRVVSLWVPDREGHYEDVVLGYDCIERYVDNQGERFLGACVGRYANRIAKGQFTLEGETYQLSTFNNGQCLHGGDKGFDRVVWTVKEVTDHRLVLTYLSKDGEEGFPGNLSVEMTYELTPQNEFHVAYHASTDKTTVVNLSHHSFFNLKGEGNGSILDHELMIHADAILPVDSVLIPLGSIQKVEDTPFDFRTPHPIGERISEENLQLKNSRGYDHNWILTRQNEGTLELVASLYEPQSGRLMEVETDQIGLQFYSGNFFDGKSKGKYGRTLDFRSSVALETQKFPDSPNHACFPTTVLHPKEVYTHHCVYRFSTR